MRKYTKVGYRPKGKNKKKTEFHGMYRSPEHICYMAMISRCERPADISYPNYGGRGITVCQRWRQSFIAFYEDMGPRPPGTTLDRKDTNGNYTPDNCRWATKKEQRHNSRQGLYLLSLNGEVLCLADWSKKLGIRENKLRYRISRGWPVEKILSTKNYLNNGKEAS